MDGQIHEYHYEQLWHLRVAERERFGDRFKEVHISRLAELGHAADVAYCAQIDTFADLLPRYDGTGLKLG